MVRAGRYAAIDIGTVTCRMLVADVTEAPDGSAQVHPITKEYAVTNLGEGVDATHRLSQAALGRVSEAIDGFVATLHDLDECGNLLENTLVMATSASRDAENADEFASLMEERGLVLNVISGETEAAMSFLGASSAFAGEHVAVVDVGGGSTEVSLGVAGDPPRFSHSFDVGCRRVTERFWDGYPPSEAALSAARKWIRGQFAATFAMAGAPFRMLAVAGTATSAVSIRERMHAYDASRVHGSVVTADELHAIASRLASKDLSGLERVVGLDPRRAPVIVAGMVILQEAMTALGAPSFTASESDILEGMIMYNAMAEHTGN